MKREKWGYLIAFLCGVVLGNVLGNNGYIDFDIMNRNNMRLLYLDEINADSFFVQVLFLRIQVVILLWGLSEVISKRMVRIGFGCIICLSIGMIFATAMIANGLWGVWFLLCAWIPHGGLYTASFLLWSKMQEVKYAAYQYESRGMEYLLLYVIIIFFVVGGCACEAYLSPYILENVINS